MVFDACIGVQAVRPRGRGRVSSRQLCRDALANPALRAAMLELFTAILELASTKGATEVPPTVSKK